MRKDNFPKELLAEVGITHKLVCRVIQHRYRTTVWGRPVFWTGLCASFEECGMRDAYFAVDKVLRALGGRARGIGFFWRNEITAFLERPSRINTDTEAEQARMMMLAFLYEWTREEAP